LNERLQRGLQKGFAFYEKDIANRPELSYYGRLRDLKAFRDVPEAKIRSTGYVVDSLEAAVWSLVQTDSFMDSLLMAVNLGDDSDTVGAIAGGLAALFYGYDGIPEDWLAVIKRREWIEEMCKMERIED
jgi:ADP-ribosylglycohydrolase